MLKIKILAKLLIMFSIINLPFSTAKALDRNEANYLGWKVGQAICEAIWVGNAKTKDEAFEKAPQYVDHTSIFEDINLINSLASKYGNNHTIVKAYNQAIAETIFKNCYSEFNALPESNRQSTSNNLTAIIYDPPSNVRKTPNGAIICTVNKVTEINIYENKNGWYSTDICNKLGYIHQSQIRIQKNNFGNSTCVVVNIKTGQLAVRKSPEGEAIVGLDNNNTVQYIRGEFPWYYIQVINGPNSKVNGRQGWVNANYLNCR